MASTANGKTPTQRMKRAATMAVALESDKPLTVRLRLRLTRALHPQLLDLLAQCPEEQLGPVIAQLAQSGALHKTLVESGIAFPSGIAPLKAAAPAAVKTATPIPGSQAAAGEASPVGSYPASVVLNSFLSFPAPVAS